MYLQTGQQVMMFTTKTSHESYGKPMYHINNATVGFTDTTFKMEPEKVLHHMESYAIEGAEGVARCSRTIHAATKGEVVVFLLKSLREFDYSLTGRYR